MTASESEPEQERQVRSIEKNLSITRKLAACGVKNWTDIESVLLPILPMKHQIEIDKIDLVNRVNKRIKLIAPKANSAILNSDIDVDQVSELLGKIYESSNS